MKMSKDDYEVILTHFKAINKIAFWDHVEFVKTDSSVKDLQKRLRWDCLFSHNPAQQMTYFVCDYLYKKGLEDSHIDTALKKAMDESGLLTIALEKTRGE